MRKWKLLKEDYNKEGGGDLQKIGLSVIKIGEFSFAC